MQLPDESDQRELLKLVLLPTCRWFAMSTPGCWTRAEITVIFEALRRHGDCQHRLGCCCCCRLDYRISCLYSEPSLTRARLPQIYRRALVRVFRTYRALVARMIMIRVVTSLWGRRIKAGYNRKKKKKTAKWRWFKNAIWRLFTARNGCN